jgi:hypothetical protein
MLRRVGAWLAVWAVSMATWMLFVVTLAPEEMAAGAVAATAATVAIAVVYRFEPVRVRPGAAARWLARCWRVPWQVLADTVRLAAALWRQVARGEAVRGRFRVLEFPDDPSAALATTRQVLATTVGSLAPNAYVVGFGDGRVLVHQLLPVGDPIPPPLLAPGRGAGAPP